VEKDTRQRLERLTQNARRLLEQEFREQLEGRYDILLDGQIPLAAGAHLSARERVTWDKLVAAIAHKRTQGMSSADAVAAYLREAAFHTLNRFVALKMLEARKLVQECISRVEDSAGFKEFIALAPGLVALPDKGYRLYVECLFDEIAQEVRALFDRRDVATLLWPRRQALLDLLAALNDGEVASVWAEDETIGWVYQYFNGEDERRQMRAESQAPRNSRELAVRNQFFTPRYVVQFLTDNTLARTWCEMRGGDTQLVHRDYLVRDENGFTPRPKKDPRELRVLDPACGSGHFLLYAFDLLAGEPNRGLAGIYEEAWHDTASPVFARTGRTLREDYPTLESLRRALPALVLEHNLHGVDIDPRAAQIAALALWMRAQRAFNDHKVPARERPVVARTNVVTAEPMPGDPTLVAEFAATLRPHVLGELFRQMVEEMRLAGELGSLLKIDRALQSTVAKAREQFVREQREPQRLLPGLERPRKPQLEFDLSGISDETFFDSAEERIVQALQAYTAGAPASMSVRRQLFADDASQGIAFIDVCRKRFDVLLMNPPFGLPIESNKSYLNKEYPGAWTDLYNSFITRADTLVSATGSVGAIIPDRLLVSKKSASVRKLLLSGLGMATLVDIGPEVMDGAAVHAVMFTAIRSKCDKIVHLKSRNEEPSSRALALQRWTQSAGRGTDLSNTATVPGSPFVVSSTTALSELWRCPFRLQPDHAVVATGGKTFDDFRFLRVWWEVDIAALGDKWLPVDVGGDYMPGLAIPRLVQNWHNNGREVRAKSRQERGTDAQVMQSSRFWFQNAISFPYTSSIGFGPRLMLGGTIFSTDAVAIIPHSGDDMFWLLAVLLSSTTDQALSVFGSGRKTENGSVKSLPIARPGDADALAADALQLVRIALTAEQSDETSRSFRLANRPSLTSVVSNFDELAARIDRNAASSYACPIEAPQTPVLVQRKHRWLYAKSVDHEAMVSEAMGVLFGRWRADAESIGDSKNLKIDFRTATVDEITRRSSLSIKSGSPIFVDDAGHSQDLVHQLSFLGFELLAGDAEAAFHGPLSHGFASAASLRHYLSTRFFEYHIARYSAGGRAAPIYWQLATASGAYSVWCYIHCATSDTLFRVLNDFVGPKLDHEKVKLDRIRLEAGATASSSQRREIEQQETFVGELKALKVEVARVAPLWKPNLDDGVIVNFAPLWRLVPQTRSWQNDCRTAWDHLVAGDYDWAHLAMHLWPERVVPRCAEDRSLAIAHDLEEVFWREDTSGNWHRVDVPEATLRALIEERTSSSVKAALKDLLAAPAPTGKSGGRRASSAPDRAPAPRRAAPATSAPARSSPSELDEGTLTAVRAAIAAVAEGASKADVQATTGLTDADWNCVIAALVERGDVTRTGQKRGTRYHAKNAGGTS
jgi:hypothetical protein